MEGAGLLLLEGEERLGLGLGGGGSVRPISVPVVYYEVRQIR